MQEWGLSNRIFCPLSYAIFWLLRELQSRVERRAGKTGAIPWIYKKQAGNGLLKCWKYRYHGVTKPLAQSTSTLAQSPWLHLHKWIILHWIFFYFHHAVGKCFAHFFKIGLSLSIRHNPFHWSEFTHSKLFFFNLNIEEGGSLYVNSTKKKRSKLSLFCQGILLSHDTCLLPAFISKGGLSPEKYYVYAGPLLHNGGSSRLHYA